MTKINDNSNNIKSRRFFLNTSNNVYSLFVKDDDIDSYITIFDGIIKKDESLRYHIPIKYLQNISIDNGLTAGEKKIIENDSILLNALDNQNVKNGDILTYHNEWCSKSLSQTQYLTIDQLTYANDDIYKSFIPIDLANKTLKVPVFTFPSNLTYSITWMFPCPTNLSANLLNNSISPVLKCNLFWLNNKQSIYTSTIHISAKIINKLTDFDTFIDEGIVKIRNTSKPNSINCFDKWEDIPIQNYVQNCNKMICINVERNMDPKYENTSLEQFNILGLYIKYDIIV